MKAVTLREVQESLPDRILGAAWRPVREQIEEEIFHDLFLVGFSPRGRLVRIERVSANALRKSPEVFAPREPLRETARRAGWQGFTYDLRRLPFGAREQVFPELPTGRRAIIEGVHGELGVVTLVNGQAEPDERAAKLLAKQQDEHDWKVRDADENVLGFEDGLHYLTWLAIRWNGTYSWVRLED